MRLWTEENLPPLKNGDLLPKCSSLGQQSDIVRYEALLSEGGVYVDTDMECARNIEPLVQDADFFALCRDPRIQSGERYSNALFGTRMGHPILSEVVTQLRKNFRPAPWTAIGPIYFSSILKDHIEEFLSLPCATSFDFNKGRRHGPARITARTYLVNHHSSKWFPPSAAPLRKN